MGKLQPRLALLPVLLGIVLAGCGNRRDKGTVLRFWAMGREGEVVREMLPEFEAAHPGIRVEVQQIPWSAAHEKLLTAFVGGSVPDVAQLGNTWVAEFAALKALRSLDDAVAASAVVHPSDHFAGIWDTNVIDGVLYGIPWYVDTRVLFYRTDLLAEAGFPEAPQTWSGWRAALEAVTRQGGEGRFGILLPLNEWTQPAILGLQTGATLLRADNTRGNFTAPDFARAFAFYLDLFRDGLAPPVANNEVANLYQEFARGTFAMYISGPWNVGEFRRRLPLELHDSWATAPLPAPDGQAATGRCGLSLAGGSSLVVFGGSRHPDAAWQLIEFLLEPQRQVAFARLTGDLPAHRAAWKDSALAGDPLLEAFRVQLDNVVATPKIPEWEQIADRIWHAAERAVRGAAAPDQALEDLDAEVDGLLAKRRWLKDHRHQGAETGKGGPVP